jgi:hypothetical protein
MLLVSACLLVGCGKDESLPQCARGEMRYSGRPAPRLFSFDLTCRKDGFSYPTDKSCKSEGGEVKVAHPWGQIAGDRFLTLADLSSVGSNRALVFGFGFVDRDGGSAPLGWGIVSEGPASYLAGWTEGSARFLMTTSVVDYSMKSVEGADVMVPGQSLSEPVEPKPGRLEIEEADASHLRGRFYLFYETPTKQPQDGLSGCFDLNAKQLSAAAEKAVILAP